MLQAPESNRGAVIDTGGISEHDGCTETSHQAAATARRRSLRALALADDTTAEAHPDEDRRQGR